MSRRGICYAALLSIVLAAAPTARGETLDEVKKAIASKYKNYKTLQYKMKSTSNVEMGEGMSMKSDTDMTILYQRKDDKTVLSRVEMKNKNTNKTGENEVTMETSSLMVSDGTYVYSLSDYAGTKQASKTKVDPSQQDVFNQDELFKQMEQMFSLKLLPEETVDGKPCYVLEMIPKQDMMKQMTSKSVQYFDKKTGIGLKTLTYDPKGKVNGTTTITDIKIDEAIPADKFEFKAPAGVEVVDHTKG